MIIESLGFVEIRGAANAILIADAMVKSSNVRIISETRLDPGQLTVIVEGDIGACMAAVEVGANLAKANNCYISSLVKGKPDNAVEGLFDRAHVSPGADPAAARTPAAVAPKQAATPAPAPKSKQPAAPAPVSQKAVPASKEPAAAGKTRAPAASESGSKAQAAAPQAGKHAKKDVTADELVQFIRTHEDSSTTVSDVARHFGIGLREARSKLKQLIDEQRAERFESGIRLLDATDGTDTGKDTGKA